MAMVVSLKRGDDWLFNVILAVSGKNIFWQSPLREAEERRPAL
jgi:hypothetical protein